jgi:hypothetical protein
VPWIAHSVLAGLSRPLLAAAQQKGTRRYIAASPSRSRVGQGANSAARRSSLREPRNRTPKLGDAVRTIGIEAPGIVRAVRLRETTIGEGRQGSACFASSA